MCLQELIGPDPQVSVRHQCELLDLCRGTYDYQCAPETEEHLALMRRLDQLHPEHPVYGSRKLTVSLRREGVAINRNGVVRLLRLMGIEAIYAKPKTSLPAPGHQIYPYLLRGLEVPGPDQVWRSDSWSRKPRSRMGTDWRLADSTGGGGGCVAGKSQSVS